MDWKLVEQTRSRKDAEIGARYLTEGSLRIALVSPTPYFIAMSSLGYQTVYRLFNEVPGIQCERSFLPDDPGQYQRSRTPLFSYENEVPVRDFDILALSVAWELELPGIFQVMALSGIPAKREERNEHHPLVLAGGPITFSNPLPLAPFADVIILGEAETAIGPFVSSLQSGPSSRESLLLELAEYPGFYVPSVHGDKLPEPLVAPLDLLPARSSLVTSETELADMFLVEPERGCSRTCAYCVMRRESSGGMRKIPAETLLALIPDDVRRVGLVGAAVTDYPQLSHVVRKIISTGKGVGVSSLRADKLNPELVGLLAQAGYRQLTVAADGASERLRGLLQRRIREAHLIRSAELAAGAGMSALKVYMMLGVPDETDEDVDEAIRLLSELSVILPVVVSVSFFVAKRRTPLDGSPFMGFRILNQRLKQLGSETGQRVEVRPASVRWAWIEYCLAQGNAMTGLAAFEAWKQGGRFSDWKKTLRELAGVRPPGVRSGA